MDGRSRVFAMSYTEVCEIAKTSVNFRQTIKRTGDSVARSSCKDTVSLSAENSLPPFATASFVFSAILDTGIVEFPNDLWYDIFQ